MPLPNDLTLAKPGAVPDPNDPNAVPAAPAADMFGGYGQTAPAGGYGGAPVAAPPVDNTVGGQLPAGGLAIFGGTGMNTATPQKNNPGYDANPTDGYISTLPGSAGPQYNSSDDLQTGSLYTDTPWELNPQQAQEATRGVAESGKEYWASGREDFMYGRAPNAANQDIARARQMGEATAAQTNALGRGALDYSMAQGAGMQAIGADAGAYGRDAAGNVAAAGQAVKSRGTMAQSGMQNIADAQRDLGGSLDQRLTQQGAALGTGVSDVGRSAANVGGNYGSNLRDVAGRGIATAETRGREIAAAGQRYGDQLSGLENTQGPSGAQGLLNQQNNRAMNTQLALARSGRGLGGSAAAMQQAGMNVGALQQDAGNQASQLKAQEYAAWRGRQAQNLNAAAQTNIGAQTAGAGLVNQAYGVGGQALSAGGNLALGGVQTQLQGQTNAANIAQQGGLAGASAAQSGLNAASATRQAGYDFGMRGTEANAAAQAQAAGIGQAGYGQELGAYGQGAGIGQAGIGQALDANATAAGQQLSYEDYAKQIRQLEMQGGAALEQKISQDYAIQMGQQQAAKLAEQQERAAIYGAGGAAVGAAFSAL